MKGDRRLQALGVRPGARTPIQRRPVSEDRVPDRAGRLQPVSLGEGVQGDGRAGQVTPAHPFQFGEKPHPLEVMTRLQRVRRNASPAFVEPLPKRSRRGVEEPPREQLPECIG
jgi:hypothetical protein